MIAFLIIVFLGVASANTELKTTVNSNSSATLSLSYDENTINCYIVYLKARNLFTPAYNPVPSSNIMISCNSTMDSHRDIILGTYRKIFSMNKHTAPFTDCIIDNFKKTDGNDLVLLNFVYEDARLRNKLTKQEFCRLSSQSRQKIEDDLRQSYKSCNPNTGIENIFTFHSECEDPKGE